LRRRRWFYRHERKSIWIYLIVLLLLNLLPLAWLLLNRTRGLEKKIEDRYVYDHAVEFLEGRELDRAGRKEEAAALLVNLLETIGDVQLRSRLGRMRTDICSTLGRFELELGRAEQALGRFETILRVDPNDYRGPTGAGHALLDLGDTGDALEQFQDSLAMRPNQPDVVSALLELHFDGGRRERVLEVLDEYLDAVWAVKARLYFTEEWPCFEQGKSNYIEFPVVLDGEPHTYSLFPRSGRRPHERSLAAAGHIGGFELVIVDEPNVVFDLGAFRCLGSSTWPAPIPVLHEGLGSSGWELMKGIEDRGWGRFVATSSASRMIRQVDLLASDIEAIELEVTLHKPVSASMLEPVNLVRRQLGARGRQLAEHRELPIWDAPPERVPEPAIGDPSCFSFSVAGHLRKTQNDKIQIQDSFRSALPRIDRLDQALFLTGDVVWEGSEHTFNQLDFYIRRLLGIPVFVAVGNHDCHREGREVFTARYGATWRVHEIGRCRMLVLDTEIDGGDISGEQLEFALEVIESARQDPNVDHLFVFMHRVLWFPAYAEFEPLIPRANKSTRMLAEGTDPVPRFRDSLMPALADLAGVKSVWCFAGDIGTKLPIAYGARDGVHLVASGNKGAGNNWWNHYLRVFVDGDKVEVAIVALEDVGLGSLQAYTPAYWAEHPRLPHPCEVGR
jgi:tetratricopeptide (TPR) repeat protein